MNILLVGGAGHVGSFVTPYLRRRHTLRVFDIVPPKHDVDYIEGSIADPEALRRLEAIVHPAVHDRRERFLKRHRARAFVILDIPLLFETRGERRLNGVIVVTAPAWKQRRRVLARPGRSSTCKLPML